MKVEIVPNSPLVKMVEESGLEKTKAQILLDNFQNFFTVAAKWEAQAKTIKVTTAEQESDMKIARVGRLELKEMRITLEKKRKELKEQSLREGKAIDGIANALKAVIVPIEEYLEQQERFVEIQEEKKREALRLEVEKRMEEERLEKERKENLYRERFFKAVPYKQFWTTESYSFGEMSEVNFESVMTDLKKRKADYDAEQEKIRLDNEKLKKEAEEKELKARAEREAYEKELAEERSKAEAERRKQEAELQKQREEAGRKQREAEAKLEEERKIAELKRKEEQQKAFEVAEKVRKESEAKLAKERAERKILEDELRKKAVEVEVIECPHCHKTFQL